jgi:acetyl-CoA carboxylase biotin carboxyl carrier protein
MAENDSDSSEPLDTRKIHYLVRLMKRYDLTDLDVRDGQLQIRLKRRGPESVIPPSSPPLANLAAAAHQEPGAVQLATASAHRAEALAGPPTIVIKSPMVGTYYASSAPDSAAFVAVGSVVHPESTVCIIEAMKVFTDIPAGVSGTIAEILVKNGQPVEFDQPLFRVMPAS